MVDGQAPRDDERDSKRHRLELPETLAPPVDSDHITGLKRIHSDVCSSTMQKA